MSSQHSSKLIQFQGFTPSEFSRSFLHDKMSAIHEEAPFGSVLRAVFSRKNRIFKAVVTINSVHGTFFATYRGHKLKEVTNKVVGQIRKQLSKWRSRRFLPYNGKSPEKERHNEVMYDSDFVA